MVIYLFASDDLTPNSVRGKGADKTPWLHDQARSPALMKTGMKQFSVIMGEVNGFSVSM